ncbi:sugar ABC transporter ATP-binding protein [Paludicola sp. MB14-C6]|uniref:sugar ABC transporter ATP-binding protein n=1 Tax=Paludihabitans sp. MB14-C6 TaxID=3070656 RepID=UPI0027DCDAD6|nr:sugar ABC transporter ATP-binding protein [Paludicola sp. MB14-C6]WMJ23539.1 sugar ABC transporter ATP-binding protein [Paludicola sp. MB14-C6]
MAERNVVLSVENVTKRFLGTVALKDVSMKLYENEILGVMGENGAGKSTLMKILSGMYPYNEVEGKIYLHGEECKFNSPIQSEAKGIAMIYQELNLELDLTVAENILLGCMPQTKIGTIDWKKTRQLATDTLKRLHADIDVTVTARSLNPSMQQLVSIARSLVRNPKILILDEPTSVLTEGETQKLMMVLRELKEQGISCLYISHKLDEVFDLCDRMVILRDGFYISEYLKENGYDSKSVIEDMIGRKLDVMYPTIEKTVGDEVLRVENFTVPHLFAYGKNIIENASFSLKKGEILGLTGLVGSGRSELINAIFGTIPKTQGDIYLNGKKITINSPKDAKKYGIGLLTEDRKKNGIVKTMSIRENMTLTVLNKISKGLLLDHNKERSLVKKYFDVLRVKAPSDKTMITSLSGGNQQKVILAKWLMTDLKVLMLDEPTRGIDVGTKSEIYKIILDLAKNGISIVMISSELPELLAMCDRFIVLGKGTVVKEMNKDEADEVSILQASSNV